MRLWLKMLHRAVDHPSTNLFVAGVLIVSALSEAGDALFEGLLSGELATHHGVLVLGLSTGLKAIPELAEGLNKAFHGPENDEP